jgi:hypothetical protein
MRPTVGLALIVVLVAACAAATPGAPEVVTGTLVDGTGQPVPDALVTLDVFDDRNVQPGDAVPTVFHVETTSSADGRFEFRFPPTAELRRFVGANTGFVNFSLRAFELDRRLSWMWSFPREMDLDGWSDEATNVRLVPIGP